jgi:prevent-host-death family protein
MIEVGIKELKAKLSGYIDVVQKGERVIITEHGREVAIIVPISKERAHVMSLVGSGKAHWSGNKPAGVEDVRVKGKPLSVTILEERR